MSFRLQNYCLLPEITLQTCLTSLPLNESEHYIVFKCLFPTLQSGREQGRKEDLCFTHSRMRCHEFNPCGK